MCLHNDICLNDLSREFPGDNFSWAGCCTNVIVSMERVGKGQKFILSAPWVIGQANCRVNTSALWSCQSRSFSLWNKARKAKCLVCLHLSANPTVCTKQKRSLSPIVQLTCSSLKSSSIVGKGKTVLYQMPSQIRLLMPSTHLDYRVARTQMTTFTSDSFYVRTHTSSQISSTKRNLSAKATTKFTCHNSSDEECFKYNSLHVKWLIITVGFGIQSTHGMLDM